METQLILIITSIVISFLYVIILWQISKRQQLKKHDLKTALTIIGIPFVISLIMLLIYRLITFHVLLKILISIFILILAVFLIKKFYQIDWWKAIKIYLLMFLIAFLIMAAIGFLTAFLSVVLKFIL